jgi:hypothetical protein
MTLMKPGPRASFILSVLMSVAKDTPPIERSQQRLTRAPHSRFPTLRRRPPRLAAAIFSGTTGRGRCPPPPGIRQVRGIPVIGKP